MKKCNGRIKSIYKKLNKGFHRYINGTKGVISLFLAILMVPFATIAGLLINAARVDSAIAVFDEALCNASNSTLGTYDEFLRERFALLAVSQKTGKKDYDVQDFISDTFKFYMEENFGALSNTYTKSEVSAAGVYPLADTDVLLSEVLEAGKYNVPAKLVIDGLSLDDFISSFTEKLDSVSQIFDTISSGCDVATNFSECDKKFKELTDKITALETAKSAYDTAHTDFANAVSEYNKIIDKISTKQTAYETAKSALEAEEGKIPDLLQEIEDMENEVDANGNRVDNTEKIEKYKEDHKEEMKDYNTAKEAFETAERELNTVIGSSNLESAKQTVKDKKKNYIGKIDTLADAINDTKTAVDELQESLKGTFDAGKDLAKNIGKTVSDGQKKAMDDQLDELKKSKKEAEERGDTAAAAELQTQIDKADEDKTDFENANKIGEAYDAAKGTAADTLKKFAEEKKYKKKYQEEHDKLVGEFKNKVDSYDVKEGDSTTKLEDVYPKHDKNTDYYKTIDTLLTVEYIQGLQKDISKEITGSSFFALLKAIVGFIDAMFNMDIWYDKELVANIDKNKYSNIGGLPSNKDRSDRSPYSLKSNFADMDQEKSNYYKKLLGGCSNNPDIVGSATTKNVIDNIMADIGKISKVIHNWDWRKSFFCLGKIVSIVGDILANIGKLIANLIKIVVNAVYQKAILTGYIAYNIPNRTTYTGSALTGAGYSLPNLISPGQGYAFYGAEAEYIINGNYSEITNQTNVFHIVYLLRLVFNVPVVIMSSEVSTIASEAGSVTFGIGAVVVYILYFIAEPFIDAAILVNSGDIPIIKRKLFLTPSGIPDLVSSFLSLSLTEAQKESIYQDSVDVASSDKNKFPKTYKDAKETYKAKNKFEESLTYDYTKTLIIIMMLFINTDKLISRLADVIQMESSYKALEDELVFNLDKSYTYLRASGNFETNEFIKISNGTGLKSEEHVVYRGY